MQTTLVSFSSCSWDLYPCPFLVFDLFCFCFYGSYIQNAQKNRCITNKTKQNRRKSTKDIGIKEIGMRVYVCVFVFVFGV